MNHSDVSLTALIIGVVIAFALGGAWRHNRIAFGDLRDGKAKVKKLRKTAWGTLTGLIKWGLIVALTLYVTATWVKRDHNDSGPTPLIPTKSAGPKHTHKPVK
jgi:hypothetical protein